MKKAIASIMVDHPDTFRLAIYYNGAGMPLTAERANVYEDLEYNPASSVDAQNAAQPCEN